MFRNQPGHYKLGMVARFTVTKGALYRHEISMQGGVILDGHSEPGPSAALAGLETGNFRSVENMEKVRIRAPAGNPAAPPRKTCFRRPMIGGPIRPEPTNRRRAL